ncbi:hydroxyethylthiazole kinase [Roseomonas marmotae]|uniref:Hydroxyethylthiazole kinase n=1 Tax=Roseomonas marmotae TaxID=2768161 RepID=A0ABS3KFB4_9PROT|nr:hydroxyethylthiazole kinase [Roseomonas marmotae]MBO1076165.1 hydroxyethylthiazole kinase [Roseomonas marmotae]QTI81798.1 hydroxyethylthiazole kinase [Roseomonas marmotae]
MTQPDLSLALSRLRQAAPLVHNITNQVVANVTANALLAIGASPAMVLAEQEVGEFVRLTAALVINLGTLTAPQRDAMLVATAAAGEAGVPWIMDPVAAGATAFRKDTALQLLARGPRVVRGNASEIMALAGQAGGGKGVDSAHRSDAAREAARQLARQSGAVVAVTGATDYVTDGTAMLAIANGHPMLTRVTGTGCTATALIGAFLGAGLDGMQAAVAGLAVLGVAAEQAAPLASGPGSFQVALLDRLYGLEGAELAGRARISPV